MDRREQRLWQSWEDHMREWLRREDFRTALPELLKGETLNSPSTFAASPNRKAIAGGRRIPAGNTFWGRQFLARGIKRSKPNSHRL